MTNGLTTLLATLKDVPGIQGSFLLSDTGSLLARDLPAVFSDELFAEAGPRLTRLADTFESAGKRVETCLMRFRDHKIYMRRAAEGFLCVLATTNVNLPAMRTAATLVARRTHAELERASTVPTAPVSPVESSPPPTPAPSVTAPPWAKGIVYRGRKLD